jgi:hypothetical protein
VLHARVVGEDVIAALTVTEEADDAWMGSVEDANDATFGPLGAGTSTGSKDFGEDVVAVHGVLDGVAGDKDVAGVLGRGDVGYDEAIAVMVKDEAAGEFIATGGGSLRRAVRVAFGGGWGGFAFPF